MDTHQVVIHLAERIVKIIYFLVQQLYELQSRPCLMKDHFLDLLDYLFKQSFLLV